MSDEALGALIGALRPVPDAWVARARARPSRRLPTGTVTVVAVRLGDPEELLGRLGPSFADAADRALQRAGSVLRARGGHTLRLPVTVADDHAVAVFAARAAALDAAVAVAAAPGDEADPVALAVAVDEATVAAQAGDDDGTSGDPDGATAGALALAAAAAPTQVLSTVVSPQTPHVALGTHRIASAHEPVALVQLLGPGLLEQPTAPRPVGAGNTVPALHVPLVGRAESAAAIRLALVGPSPSRIVTVAGPGGAGKTSLVRVVAGAGSSLAAHYPGGVAFVALADVPGPEGVPDAIAAALAELDPGVARRGPTLLVLDNVEHVRGAAGHLAELLAARPDLQILATGQARLGMPGELVVALGPLDLPSDADDPEDVARSEAGALFAAHAARARPGFAVTAANAGDVAAIVTRLGAIPLAIELAASRAGVLPPHELRARLEESIGLLRLPRGEQAGVPPRQRSLAAALDWSLEQLEPETRLLFARLGVFAGGWTVELAEQVCENPEDPGAVLDDLTLLTDRSLVRRDDDGRFGWPEAVRDHARSLLARDPALEATTRRRHAEAFAALAEAAFERSREVLDDAFATLRPEAANVLAGVAWARRHDQDLHRRYVGALGYWWIAAGFASDGDAHIAHALGEMTFDLAGAARLQAAAAAHAGQAGEFDVARRHADTAVELWQGTGDPVGLASALIDRAYVAGVSGDGEQAAADAREARRLYAAAGRTANEQTAIIYAIQGLVAAGEADEASSMLELFGDEAARARDPLACHLQADVAILQRDWPAALRRYALALQVALRRSDATQVTVELQGMAMALAHLDPVEALVLAGAAERHQETLGVDLAGSFWADWLRDHILGTASDALGAETADRLRSDGAELRPREAALRALRVAAARVANDRP